MNGKPENTEFILYQTDDGKIRIEARMENETVWLTINQMAELFDVDKSGISRHLKDIYESGELEKGGTVANFATVQVEGKRDVSRNLDYYNLDAIISVGYRVKSQIATHFRIWATQRLKEYIIKGFVMDDDRLKRAGGGNYFEELLARIRDIRSSEKIFWRKVLDIYGTSIDYSPDAESSKLFFKTVQNKMHWAAHGHTAAEIIHERVDASKLNMGLTGWTGDRITKQETEVAKNYLKEEELDLLNRIVAAYLEFAELQAINRTPMYMKDWAKKLDEFLNIMGRDVLDHAGLVSHEAALQKAHGEYEKYKSRHINREARVEIDFINAEKDLKSVEKKVSSKIKKKKK